MQLSWRDYFELLRRTAQQAFDGVSAKVPPRLAKLLALQGIDASMWRKQSGQTIMRFGDRVRQLRQQKRMTQGMLAVTLDVSVPGVALRCNPD